jgi:hypothetical protein
MPGGRTQAVVNSAAEVGAEGLMERRQHLQEDKHHARNAQRQPERTAALYRPDEHADRNREQGRQDTAQDERHPPGEGQRSVCFRQSTEEDPLFACAQASEKTNHCETLSSDHRSHARSKRPAIDFRTTGEHT